MTGTAQCTPVDALLSTRRPIIRSHRRGFAGNAVEVCASGRRSKTSPRPPSTPIAGPKRHRRPACARPRVSWRHLISWRHLLSAQSEAGLTQPTVVDLAARVVVSPVVVSEQPAAHLGPYSRRPL